MLQFEELRLELLEYEEKLRHLRESLGLGEMQKEIAALEEQSAAPDFWNDLSNSQAVLQRISVLKNRVADYTALESSFNDALMMIELSDEEGDLELLPECRGNVETFIKELESQTLATLLNGEYDGKNAILTFHAGAGGTEAQDWAEILLRMYLRWAESRGWKTELMEVSGGDVAGIKSATFRVEGEYAYGWLKTEIGVHRLVRKSPFDSDNRRHTSFTSVFVSPEVDDDIDIDINPADLRTDVYRSSGAGGQHVNKTESAVRITHIPTNTVVACQTGRSQHQNRDTAMKMLAAKLYELEVQKRNVERDALEATKSDIGWGSQIRNYVLDQSRIKDLRTGIERSDTQKVLDGDLDEFIEASLKSGLEAGSKRTDAA